MSQFLSVSFEHACPSADEIRTAAYLRAKDAGEKGVCLVQANLPDKSAPINVVVNLAAGEATVVLPLPCQIQKLSFGEAYTFENGVYVVSEQSAESISEAAQSAFPDAEALYLISVDRASAFSTAVLCLSGTLQPISRTVEGAAAAAMFLHSELEQGTMEVTIGQSGGILEIGMRKVGGEVTGLSAGGPVEVTA